MPRTRTRPADVPLADLGRAFIAASRAVDAAQEARAGLAAELERRLQSRPLVVDGCLIQSGWRGDRFDLVVAAIHPDSDGVPPAEPAGAPRSRRRRA